MSKYTEEEVKELNEVVPNLVNQMSNATRKIQTEAHKNNGEYHNQHLKQANKTNLALKEDLENNPDKYTISLVKKINQLHRKLAEQTLKSRALEKQSINAVSELQIELKKKNEENKQLKSVLGNISFLSSEILK